MKGFHGRNGQDGRRRRSFRRSLATAVAVSGSGAAGTAAASGMGSGIACYPSGRRRARLRVARWAYVHHAKCRRRPGNDGEPKVPSCRTVSQHFINIYHQKTTKMKNRKSADIALFYIVLFTKINTKISADIALFQDC
jgi:hypothetical protein